MIKRDSKLLEQVIKNVNKQFGKGTIQQLDGSSILEVPSLSTGSLGLDSALGIGGIPEGRIVEIYGPESSGKTTLTLHLISELQKKGGVCAFIDVEHALDPYYAQNLGVKIEDLLIVQPTFAEEALDIVDTLVQSNAIDMIIVDSVAALTPKTELDGEMGDQTVGLQARLMSKMCRKITGVTYKNNVTVIFINQIRMKIGMMGYGSPETTTGGNALKFYSSVRLDIRKIASVKQGDEQIANKVRVKVVKNKVAPPFKQAEFEIDFGKGISKVGELIDYGIKYDIIDKAGSWFSYGETKIGQGREKVKEFLYNNPKIFEEIEKEVRKNLFSEKGLVEVVPVNKD